MTRGTPTRRQLLQSLAATGVGSAVFQRALAADAEQSSAVTPEMVQSAEWVAGITLTDDERSSVAKSATSTLRDFRALHAVPVGYDVPPALVFDPTVGLANPTERLREPARRAVEPIPSGAPKKPDSADDLAFLPVTALAALVRSRKVSSVELT